MKRFEFRCGKVNKFWEVETQDADLVVRYGRIGTIGRISRKKCFTPSHALTAMSSQIRDKTRRGYVEAEVVAVGADAIAQLCVGHHVRELGDGLAAWLTKCLEKRIPPSRFNRMWSSFLGEESGEDDEEEVPGVTDGRYWIDELVELDLVIPLYEAAYAAFAERFVTVDEDAYTYIVAVCGDPGIVSIMHCILTQDDQGDGDDKTLAELEREFPPELGEGTPIKSIYDSSDCSVILRDGTEVRVERKYPGGTDKVLAEVFVDDKKVRKYEYELPPSPENERSPANG